MGSPQPLIEFRGIRKSFNGVEVLHGIDMQVRSGRIHALLGHNGAGKSTLIKILSGLYQPDYGEIEKRPVAGTEPCVVRFIHQDLGLVDDLTVRENLLLSGNEKAKAGILRPRAERSHAREVLARVDLELDPDGRVGNLTLGEKTLLAVARLLAENADVIVLDEVTAALTRAESDWLFAEITKFTSRGGSVVLVSHRLHEVTENADDTTILKDGIVQYDGPTPDLVELHDLLTDSVYNRIDEESMTTLEPILRMEGLEADAVGPIDLQLHAGEVVSLVGSLSSNLYAVAHLIAGQTKSSRGSATWDKAHGREVAFLPEDRHTQGILPGRSVVENMSISSLRQRTFLGAVKVKEEFRSIERFMDRLDVKPRNSHKTDIGKLSGGNQQKVLLGRAALLDPAVFVLCEPTRGVDIGTRHAIYRFIDAARSQGAAVVVVTIDVDDALAVGDRVGLIRDGKIATLTPRSEVTHEELLEKVS